MIDEVERDDDGVLGYDAWHRAFRRIVRRIVLGDGARDDEELSDLLAELMSEANGLRPARSEQLDPFMERLDEHVARAEKGSLAASSRARRRRRDTRAGRPGRALAVRAQDTDAPTPCGRSR